MVSHLGGPLRREQVGRRRGEEIHQRGIFVGRRVGDVDHHPSAAQGVAEAVTGEQINAGAPRCRQHLLAVGGQDVDHLGPDQAGGPDYDDFSDSCHNRRS